MDPIQARRRMKAAITNENANPMAAGIAAKAAAGAKPIAPRVAFSTVNGVQPGRAAAAAKRAAAPAKPLATTRPVCGVAKNPPKAAPKSDASKIQVKKVQSPCDMQQLIKAFQAGHMPHVRKGAASTRAINPVLHGFTDVDIEDDPLLVCDYVKDIMVHLKELEHKYPVQRDYLDAHVAITAKYRGVLINWMVEVIDSFKLTKETLHLSVGILDRYLGINTEVPKASLQLVGVAAMFVAHKYEEMFAIDMNDWLYICDNAYTNKEILSMEMDILTKLDFGLGRPTSIAFLRRYHKVMMASGRQHELGKYLIEQALLEYELAAVEPSVLAAGAVCLAHWLVTTREKPADAWSNLLRFYSGYAYDDIADTVTRMVVMLDRAEKSKLQAVRKIFERDQHQNIVLDEALRGTKLRTLAATTASVASS